MPFQCSRCDRFPYVCNHCPDERKCPIQHYLYMAKDAQRKYEKTLVNSRTGINMTTEELQQLNDLVSPLIRKGQPLAD